MVYKYSYCYELANIVIFVILQPGLILLFFILWRGQKKISFITRNRDGT